MNQKLTKWFDGEQKPSLVGVYQRDIPSLGTMIYSYWNGRRWGLCTSVISRAIHKDNADFKSSYQSESWRGLAENPEASNAG